MIEAGPEDMETTEIAGVLMRTAELLKTFHLSDLALQNSLSTLAERASATPDMVDLQHVDLVTQTHSDLAGLLSELAAGLAGRGTDRDRLKSALVLRSLRDALIEPHALAGAEATEPGELSLF